MQEKYGESTVVDLKTGDQAIISVNPFWQDMTNDNNKIQARIIHASHGVFIDIVVLESHPDGSERVITKIPKDVFPIRSVWPAQTRVFDYPDRPIPHTVWVPSDPVEFLRSQYGKVHVKSSAGLPKNRKHWSKGFIGRRYWMV